MPNASDYQRQLKLKDKEIARLENRIAVLGRRNELLRREIEQHVLGLPSVWGRWQEADATIMGDGRTVGVQGGIRMFVNARYQVAIFQPDERSLWHLSIKRQDGAAIRDWRELQRIKNELLGPHFEAVELFPAETRLVDGANQYHLWAIEAQFPFGFDERLVTEDQSEGVQQRPFPDDQKPVMSEFPADRIREINNQRAADSAADKGNA